MNRVLLTGLPADNLLAYLAALGTLRVLAEASDDPFAVKLGWRKTGGCWLAELEIGVEETALPGAIYEALRGQKLPDELGDFNNLTFSADDLAKIVILIFEGADGQMIISSLGKIAALASEVPYGDQKKVCDTAFRTLSGSGHQHFLGTARKLAKAVNLEQVSEALFGPWKYQNGKLSFRWDPVDDRRYAMRWKEPSSDPPRTVHAANLLAFEALPLFPVIPLKQEACTVGFRGRGSRNTFVVWPIWDGYLPLAVVRSVLSLDLQEAQAKELSERGVVLVFESQRLSIDKYRNFSPAQVMLS